MRSILSQRLITRSFPTSCRFHSVNVLDRKTLSKNQRLYFNLSTMSHPGKGSQPAKDLVQPVQVSQHGEASEQSTSSPEVQESPTSSYSIPSEGIFPIDRQGYSFPYSRLRRKMKDSMKTPLVLVACGSFNPVTFLHLRLFEVSTTTSRLFIRLSPAVDCQGLHQI